MIQGSKGQNSFLLTEKVIKLKKNTNILSYSYIYNSIFMYTAVFRQCIFLCNIRKAAGLQWFLQ